MKLFKKDLFKKLSEHSKRDATEEEILRSEAGGDTYAAGNKTEEEQK